MMISMTWLRLSRLVEPVDFLDLRDTERDEGSCHYTPIGRTVEIFSAVPPM